MSLKNILRKSNWKAELKKKYPEITDPRIFQFLENHNSTPALYTSRMHNIMFVITTASILFSTYYLMYQFVASVALIPFVGGILGLLVYIPLTFIALGLLVFAIALTHAKLISSNLQYTFEEARVLNKAINTSIEIGEYRFAYDLNQAFPHLAPNDNANFQKYTTDLDSAFTTTTKICL